MSGLPDNFADHPVSVAEIKSDRTQNAADWSAGDALIDLLRQIDRGEVEPDALVIMWSVRAPDGKSSTHYSAASPDPLTTIGLVSRQLHRLQVNMDGS